MMHLSSLLAFTKVLFRLSCTLPKYPPRSFDKNLGGGNGRKEGEEVVGSTTWCMCFSCNRLLGWNPARTPTFTHHHIIAYVILLRVYPKKNVFISS